jgi:HEAT repeat protein
MKVKNKVIKQVLMRSGNLIFAALLLFLTSCSSVEKEIERLGSPDSETRRSAAVCLARRLKDYDTPESPQFRKIVLTLARTATGDPNPYVRAAALSQLVENAPVDSPETISACLKDSAPLVREQAVSAAGKVKAGFLAPTIAKLLLQDKDASVRRACPPALESITSSQSNSAPARPDILDALCNALQDEEDSVRFAARESLKRLLGTDAGDTKDNWKRLLEEQKQKK